jgi:hypothetical protein
MPRLKASALCLILSLLLLSLTPTLAQSETHPPQSPYPDELPLLLDPAIVFPSSEHVQVVETLPLYVANQQQVSFYDYDAEEWRTYQYPEFHSLPQETVTVNFTETSAGGYVLEVEYAVPCPDCEIGDNPLDYTPPHAAFVRERWHFDLTTGLFTPFEAVCGAHARALPGEGEWVVTVLQGEYFLCNTETGQTSTALSNISSVPAPALLGNPLLSPDGRWLVFVFYYDLRVWTYDFVTDNLNYLGIMTTTSPFGSSGYPTFYWIDQHRLVVENRTINYGDHHAYLYWADAAQPDSLQLFYHRNNSYPQKLDNPTRFVWTGSAFEDTQGEAASSFAETCTTHEYNPATNEIISYAVPSVCSYGLPIPDGSGDRLTRAYPYQTKGQSLIRFNPGTRRHELIPIGNFMDLALSPSGRYVVTTVDVGHYDYQIAVVDLETRSVLLPFESTSDQFSWVEWINEHIFWQRVRPEYGNNRLLTISEGVVSVQTGRFYPPRIGLSPDKQFLLMESQHRTLDVLNLETLETTTIAFAPEGAMLSAGWEMDGVITVMAWEDDDYPRRLGGWRIRVNL